MGRKREPEAPRDVKAEKAGPEAIRSGDSDDTEGARSDAKDAKDAAPRKERVIHTRVPAVLEEELKRFADNLRVPVSNVIRTLLEDAMAAADRATLRVEQQLMNAASSLGEERRKLEQRMPRRDPLEGVLGFQAIRINVDGECAKCRSPIVRGEDAFLGLTGGAPGAKGRSDRPILVCVNCVPSVPSKAKGEEP